MKKLYACSIIFFFAMSIVAAQPNNCCTAHQLTSNATQSAEILNGAGFLPDPIEDCSCLEEGEHETYWFEFECTAASLLEFIIIPLGSGNGDYDFAVFTGQCPCGAAPLPQFATIACDFTSGTGPVGAGDPAQWGSPGAPGFIGGIPMEEGQTYFLVVDNKANNDGFTIDFSETTEIGQLPDPGPTLLDSPDVVCPGGTGVFSAQAMSAGTYSWYVNGSNVSNAVNPNFEYTFPDVGTYQVCVSFWQFNCYETEPTCTTVEVVAIPTIQIEDNFCYPGPYLADNGEEIFSPGVYDIVFESYQGCDSIVELTLIGRTPDIEVRTDFACDGDCVMFEGEMICDEGLFEKIYTNQYGCDSTISLNLITVPLEIEVEGMDTLTCHTTSLTLDARKSLVGGDTTSYLWTNSVGDTLGVDTLLSVTSGDVYTLQVTTILAADTCVMEEDIEIIADVAPPDSVVASGGTLSCTVSIVELKAASSTPNVVYEWSGPNGFYSLEQNPKVTLPGNYILTVTGENGCKTIETVEIIEITEILTATASGGTINCFSSNVTLNGNSPDPGVSYAWQGPNNTSYNGPTPSVNMPGTYLLTVTDADGCTGTAETVVMEDLTEPEASASANQILTCNNTTVFLNGNGSSFGSQFSYLWTTNNGNITDGENTLNPSVDEPGNYTLTVTNNDNGCTRTAQAEVLESPLVTAQISAQTNVLCFGENNGSATAMGGGGDDDFTYNWSNGTIGNTINGVSEGSYIVTITDGNDCTATATATITQPPALMANASANAQTMPNVDDGNASANPSGGMPGYTYLWSNGLTTSTIDGLAPGNYTVTVTDANDCESVETVTVNEIECFVMAAIEHEDESCQGFEDGSATVNLTNATDPVSYTWSNDETSQTVMGLAPGNYSVTASDANECEVVASVTILGPAALNANATATGQTAFNMDDGTATASPAGGTSPYSYQWSNGETTNTITGLAPGEYEVTVTDANDCVSTQTVTVEEFNCGVLLEVDFTDVSCNGENNGQASVLPSGGETPFTFNWSNGDTTATIGNLPVGTYDVTVTDASDCPAQAQVIISEPDELILELTSSTPAGCGSDNGTATVMASGGTIDYGYIWPDGETTPTVENLAEGTYTVSVTDANDCLTTLEVMIETDSTMDIEPPVALAMDFTVELGADGTATISPSDVDNGSTDNCDIAALALDITNFDCSHVGENAVVLTVTDLGGNEATATSTVTVVDNMAPVVDCPGNVSLPFCDPVFSFDVTATDNCSGNLTIEQTNGLPSGSTFPVGETTAQSFEVTDVGGNIAVCNFEITVAEAMAIAADITGISCFGEEDGSIGTTVTGGSPDYAYQWSNDSTTMSINNLGPGMYSVTVVDDAGCEAVEEFEINEPDDLVTTLVNIINEMNSMSDGSVDVTVSGGVMPYTYEWTDLDGNVVGTLEDIDSLPAGTYQLFVTDSNDCVSSGSYTIQNTTSTNNLDLDAFIKIFPNPTTGSLTVEFIDLPIAEMDVTIHDIVGRIALNQSNARVSGNKYLLDLGEYPEGVYLVKLTIEGQVVTKRIVRVD